MLVLLAAFTALNAFNLKFLNPATTGEIVVFSGLSVLAFLLFVAVLVLLVRNVLKLYADQRSSVMGTRLRTRMLWGAVLVSVIPLVFMFLFSYDLMNRAVDRWFSQNPDEIRDDSTRLALELAQYTSANARVEAESIAASLPAVDTAAPNAATSSAATPSTESSISTKSRCRTALPSSTAKPVPLPRSTCRGAPAPPRRSSHGSPNRVHSRRGWRRRRPRSPATSPVMIA